MNIQVFLSNNVAQAMAKAGANIDSDPQVRRSAKAQFGDYQANGIMAMAKKMGLPPRELAQRVVDNLNADEMIEKVEIAGPGFINLFLSSRYLAQQAESAQRDPHLSITRTERAQTIVVDYSGPNIAKEMHIGHLRSTIIGDATVRVLQFLGHNVIRANHVGDWGTQFGMLIAYLERIETQHHDDLALADLETFYRTAKKTYDEDEVFAKRSREYVVKLQQADPHCRMMWRKLVDITMSQNTALYQRLNVTLTLDDTMGESTYNKLLHGVVEDLKNKGLATKSNGATVVFLDEYKNKEGDPMGVIIQKSDGGYLYTTTDIAAINYRYNTCNAERILYYTDSRQHQHLEQVWLIAKKAGYIPETLPLEHHMFGMMLGKDGKPFKTREGNTIKLSALLDEAVGRAEKLLAERDHQHLSESDRKHIANIVAIGAVKYADLSKNRTTDYVFDWDTMLAFEGNTAPYLLYAYTRIISIFRKMQCQVEQLTHTTITINNDIERTLVLRLLQLEEAVLAVAKDGTPHIMCAYLYDIATLFSSFYEHCPILQADNEETQKSRLAIAALTARTLKIGFDMLGINTVEQM